MPEINQNITVTSEMAQSGIGGGDCAGRIALQEIAKNLGIPCPELIWFYSWGYFGGQKMHCKMNGKPYCLLDPKEGDQIEFSTKHPKLSEAHTSYFSENVLSELIDYMEFVVISRGK